jgi:transcription termination/antitermination protein NusA
MSNPDMFDALQALAADRGISVDTLMAALADALESAYKRMPDAYEYAWVTIDPGSFDIRVFAQELDEEGVPVGEEFDVTPDDFGRIAAQTARQVMTQRIREAERELKYEEYAGREGDIVTGIVQQNDSRYTLLDLGRVEALLPQAEQVPHERPESSARLKAYIVEVRKTAKGPQIVVSRTHPGLILELFKLEVPEIADGVVEIRACAREPGHRTKMAVASNDPNVDPVGACVGARGSRVRQVVTELRGEKIDIVAYSEDHFEFVAKALQPARVKEVRIDEHTGTAMVIVPDHQLSLAIGKEGQNARLAGRLTGWAIDIKSETQLAEAEAAYAAEDWAEGEWIVDEETGEQLWQPAEGGPAVSASEYLESSDEGASAPEVDEAPAGTSSPDPAADPGEAGSSAPSAEEQEVAAETVAGGPLDAEDVEAAIEQTREAEETAAGAVAVEDTPVEDTPVEDTAMAAAAEEIVANAGAEAASEDDAVPTPEGGSEQGAPGGTETAENETT